MMFHFPFTGDQSITGVGTVSSSTRGNPNLSYSSPYPYYIIAISIFYDNDNNTNSTDIRYDLKNETDHNYGGYGNRLVGERSSSSFTFWKSDTAQRSDSCMLATPLYVAAKKHLWIRGDLSSSSANEYAILLHLSQSA